MEKTSSKPLWWSIFILVTSILYLIPEAIFNAELVEVAGGIGVDEGELKNIELFGRFISGIGVSLLLIDLLIPRSILEYKSKTILCAFLITGITWPAVFFGQKALIDAFVVNNSTSEQRQHAVLSTVVKNSVLEESVVISNLEYNPDAVQTSIEKTFLSLFPALVYSNDNFIKRIENNKEDIVKNMVNNKMTENFDDYYSEFSLLRDSIKKEYQNYREASNELNNYIKEKIKNPDAATQEYWSIVRSSLSSGWKRYKKGTVDFDNKMERLSKKLAPKIYDYFERKDRACKRKRGNSLVRCYERYEKRYAKEMSNYGMSDIPDHTWLIKSLKKREEKTMERRLVEGVFTFGLSLVQEGVEAIQDKASGPQYVYHYTKNPKHYESKLREIKKPEFKKESGYEYGLNVNQFNSHRKTRSSIVSEMKKKGVTLPSSWTVNDRATFNRAVIKKIAMESESKWKQDFADETDMGLEPNLSWNEFKELPQIKEKIYNNIPEKYSTFDINLDWNNALFYRNVVLPIVERETQDYLNLLSSERELFGDGERHGVTGKNALRTVMVPPISMAISLFLVILTAIKIPFKVYELVMKDKGINKIVMGSVYFGAVLLILIVPSFVSANYFTKESNAISYFFEEMKDKKTSFGSYSLKWVLSVQPLIQPIGSSMEDAIGVVKSFNNVNDVFKKWDKKVFPSPHESSNYKPLFVETIPSYATVKVMNIVPKYYDGMILENGTYDILVIAKGYASQRRDVELGEETHFVFNLED